MPIPQFHRTPKTRKRRTRRGVVAQRSANAHDAEAAAEPAQELVGNTIRDSIEDAALLRANDDAPPDQEEVPALLSHWPPERRKSS